MELCLPLLYSRKVVCDPECWGISTTQERVLQFLHISLCAGHGQVCRNMTRGASPPITAKAGYRSTRGKTTQQKCLGSERSKAPVFSMTHLNDWMRNVSLCVFTCVCVCECTAATNERGSLDPHNSPHCHSRSKKWGHSWKWISAPSCPGGLPNFMPSLFLLFFPSLGRASGSIVKDRHVQ